MGGLPALIELEWGPNVWSNHYNQINSSKFIELGLNVFPLAGAPRGGQDGSREGGHEWGDPFDVRGHEQLAPLVVGPGTVERIWHMFDSQGQVLALAFRKTREQVGPTTVVGPDTSPVERIWHM